MTERDGSGKEEEKEKRVRKREEIKKVVYEKLDERGASYVNPAEKAAQSEIDSARDRIKGEKDKDESKSLFELIRNELDRYNVSSYTTPAEVQGRHVLRYLQEAKQALTEKAKSMGVLEDLKDRISAIQSETDKDIILAKLNSLRKEAGREKIGKKQTKIGSSEDEVPYNDFKGVAAEYAEVAYLVTQLAFKKAELEVSGKNPDTPETKQLENKIALYGWDDPIGAHPEVFIQAKHIVEEKARKIREDRLRERTLNSRPEYSQTSQLPRGIGATFRESIAESMARQTGAPHEGHVVPILRIDKVEDRQEWMRKNFYAFLHGGLDTAGTWRQHAEFWVNNDLLAASRIYKEKLLEGKTGKEKADALAEIKKFDDEIEKTKKEMERLMAIHAPVGAMQASGGSHSAYAIYMTRADNRGNVDLDYLDAIGAPKLLEDNPQFYEQSFKGDENKRTRFYYSKIIKGMGLNDTNFVDIDIKNGKVKKMSQIKDVDLDAFTNEETGLFKYFGDGKKGFDDWIEAMLDKEEAANEKDFQETKVRKPLASREERWLAAKTAVDLFVDDGKWTKWKGVLEKKGIASLEDTGRTLKKNERPADGHEATLLFKMDPFKTWGGDPLASIQYAPTLPHKIKHTFEGEDGDRLMRDVALAFRPEDILDYESLIPISAVGGGFKTQVRYNIAVNSFLGGSRGTGVADWGKDGVMGFQEAVEKIDTYWGIRDKFKLKDGMGEISGKELEGVMIARLLRVKAEAKIRQSAEPTVFERISRPLSTQVEDPRSRPNSEAIQWLLGPNMNGKAGYLSDLISDRVGVKFQDEARKKLTDTISMLDTNDQNDFWRELSELLKYIGLSIGMLAILAEYGFKVSGLDVDLTGGGGGGGGKRK